jgi:hypothetical protein
MTKSSNGTSSSRVQVTFFSDVFATTKHEGTYQLDDLAAAILNTDATEKARLPLLKLARFGDRPNPRTGSLRYDDNIVAVSGLEADYDGGTVTPEAAEAILRAAGVQSLIYTSPSHRPDFPRWRILCPFSRELAPDRRAPMVARLNGILGGILAPESFTLSQAYYYGSVTGNPHHRIIPT